ncbi:hypothetical protein HPB58_13950 [Priestia filamentosa]|jgi:hypothetical protein|uniref:hypothetical protein n=1 Tax=Priestia filamentosa TaxID=1402861 RepID=UPI001FB2991C|nr:hypothetical protein [Priestia filamentosa]MED3727439.1 hypothetical protein [Priestia filamentosa]UOE58447.1 hypothetical protein HPB58_13950 [Priestia filamentosa]
MIDNQEVLFFRKELARLLDDYRNCEKPSLKKEISEDISLLSEVIYGDEQPPLSL